MSTADSAPAHVAMDQFPVADGCLQVGGQAVTEIAQSLGGGPFFAYDSRVMDERVQSLRNALPDAVHVHYAIKANPMQEVVDHLARAVDGLDVASAGELRIALAAGAAPDAISFAGPGKSEEDLQLAVASGVTLNVESERELQRIIGVADNMDRRASVAVRVNPAFELKSAGMKMGSGPKPFGVDAERVPDMLRSMEDPRLDFVGFHIYSGSQNLRHDAVAQTQTLTFELAYELAKHAPGPVRSLNIGGGFGVPYFPGEQRLDLAPIGANLASLVGEARTRLPDARVVMELGRYLTAEAGVYICEIIDRKESRGETFLVTNGGLHHHLAASGNFGQVIRKNYPLAVANRMDEPSLETVNVVGPLCTPLDILGHQVQLPRAEPGDLIAVFQSGAYGFSASPRDFLSHPQPRQVLLGA
ncbi:MAG: pyridoxal-dependent decarboxylase, exosortase A system-associated [Halioglobus sp.]|nr:pyridoxal-dependent decarboxylase, exosortase A system-associated [Halioglobus sp.]